MVDSTQARDATLQWRRLADSFASSPLLVAAGATLAVGVFLLLVIEATVLSGLPAYAAIVLVFLSMTLVPGWFVWRALSTSGQGWIEQGVFALAFGLGVAAPPALLALVLDLDLAAFLWFHIVFAPLVCGVATLFFLPFERADADREAWTAPAIVLAAIVAIGVGGIVTSPLWAGEEVSRDFDDWRYMAYVNSYLHKDHLDPLQPIGIGERPEPRIANNSWLVLEAGVARASDSTAEEVLISYLAPVLTVFALGAVYVLALGLFKRRDVALLAVALTLGYALIDGSPHEGFGRNILVRMAEDKAITTFIMLPLSLLLMVRYLSKPDWRTFAAFSLLSVSYYALHPQALLFLAIILAGLAIVRCALAMSLRPLAPLVLLGVPVLAPALAQLATWEVIGDRPSLFTPGFVWREDFRLVRLPGDMIMGNYHLILHPLLLASIVIVPVLFWRARTSIAHQVLLVATVGWLPWLFFPPLATASAKLVSTTFMIREPWIAPVGIVLALAVVETLSALQRKRWAGVPESVRRLTPLGAAALPVVALVIVLGSALIVQETYIRADGGAFYEWTSSESFVPGTDSSIFLGGNDRLFGREWRRGDREDALFAYLKTEVPDGSVVLAPPRVSTFLPGVVANVTPVYSSAPPLAPESVLFGDFYYGRNLQGADLEAALREAGVDYVVVLDGSPRFEKMRDVPGAELSAKLGIYDLFTLLPEGQTAP